MQLKIQNTMKKQLILVLLFPIIALAQQPLRRADAKFEQEAYISAIKIYEHLANRGKGTAEIYEKLITSMRIISKLKNGMKNVMLYKHHSLKGFYTAIAKRLNRQECLNKLKKSWSNMPKINLRSSA
jgi:hypothetical protein